MNCPAPVLSKLVSTVPSVTVAVPVPFSPTKRPKLVFSWAPVPTTSAPVVPATEPTEYFASGVVVWVMSWAATILNVPPSMTVGPV